MSESKTGAGNQEFKSLNVIENLKDLNNPKNFCFHVYAQKSLFIAKKCNVFFGTAASSPDPVSLAKNNKEGLLTRAHLFIT